MAKDTKQKLLDTAKDLIGASSYASVGVAEICRQAEVNKGSFYHFFESKEELAIAALEDDYKEHEHTFNEVFSPAKPAMQQLDDFIELFYQYMQEVTEKYGKVCGCPALNLGSEMATQNQHFSESVNKIIKKYDKYFTSLVQSFINDSLIDKNADPKTLGKVFHTYIIGLKVLAKVENNPLILKKELKPTLLKILGAR